MPWMFSGKKESSRTASVDSKPSAQKKIKEKEETAPSSATAGKEETPSLADASDETSASANRPKFGGPVRDKGAKNHQMEHEEAKFFTEFLDKASFEGKQICNFEWIRQTFLFTKSFKDEVFCSWCRCPKEKMYMCNFSTFCGSVRYNRLGVNEDEIWSKESRENPKFKEFKKELELP
eukprot:GHVP01009890.1.p2 GENE.GHVP01009890.1~~GHVP01009890.1.p2  ORF type:complete len:178 (-),score=36.15 GHVP01009890.1:132-665(-)